MRAGKSAESEPAGNGDASVDGPENISQIREILFGGQMAEYERRFARIEDRIASATSAIQNDFGERLAALEALVKRELKALAKDLRSEHEKGIAGVERELEAARGDLQTGVDDLGRELAAHAEAFRDDLQREHELATEMIARESGELRESKTDRTTLATLLKEVAARLGSAQEGEAAPEER